jgi:hypothetical protein
MRLQQWPKSYLMLMIEYTFKSRAEGISLLSVILCFGRFWTWVSLSHGYYLYSTCQTIMGQLLGCMTYAMRWVIMFLSCLVYNEYKSY